MKDCKDKCKVIIKEGNMNYLLAFSYKHIKMATQPTVREKFFMALEEDNLELKVVRK